ncbi:MAG: rod shape-determining protein MreC [Candidatus Beckwithbacteria bacterium]|nr:rod shape-determining protein MreC [Patescibacteria group bacterium]
MRKIAILLVLSLAIFILDKGSYFNWLKSPILKVIRPVQLNLRGVAVEKMVNGNEVFELIDKAEMIKLRQENERLRELLGTKISPAWKFIPANILKSEGESLVIDVGSEIGVSSEMVVVGLARDKVNNGVLLGRVDEVFFMQSKIRLLKSADSNLGVVTESGSVGVVTGDGEKLNLRQVLQKQDLVKGELILSKGGDGWPADLVVGRVGEVFRVDTKIYLEAKIDELIETDNLSQVFVVSF